MKSKTPIWKKVKIQLKKVRHCEGIGHFLRKRRFSRGKNRSCRHEIGNSIIRITAQFWNYHRNIAFAHPLVQPPRFTLADKRNALFLNSQKKAFYAYVYWPFKGVPSKFKFLGR